MSKAQIILIIKRGMNMGKDRKSVGRAVICMIASMLLSVFVSVLAIVLSVKLGFASNNSIIDAMDEVDYYGMIYDEFIGKCESLAIPNGLSLEVFDGVFSKEQLRSDGNEYLSAELNSNTFNVNFDRYKTKLSENIQNYVVEKDLTVDGDINAIIEDFSDEIMDYYVDIIRVPYASAIGVVFRAISRYFPFVFIAMLVFTILTIWIICIQNPHKKNRIFRYMAYSTMSGAISTLVIPIYCAVTKFYERIQLHPEYIYRFMMRYIENGIRIMSTIGISLFIASLAMIAISSYIKYKYIYPHGKHHSEEENIE